MSLSASFLARRYRLVCLLNLDSSGARLWTMGPNFGHLVLLHRGLYSSWSFNFGSLNEFSRLLLRFNGTWTGTSYRKYHWNEKLKMTFNAFSDQYRWEFTIIFLCEKYSQLLVTAEKKNYCFKNFPFPKPTILRFKLLNSRMGVWCIHERGKNQTDTRGKRNINHKNICT